MCSPCRSKARATPTSSEPSTPRPGSIRGAAGTGIPITENSFGERSFSHPCRNPLNRPRGGCPRLGSRRYRRSEHRHHSDLGAGGCRDRSPRHPRNGRAPVTRRGSVVRTFSSGPSTLERAALRWLGRWALEARDASLAGLLEATSPFRRSALSPSGGKPRFTGWPSGEVPDAASVSDCSDPGNAVGSGPRRAGPASLAPRS
jgi:hypothetical protein